MRKVKLTIIAASLFLAGCSAGWPIKPPVVYACQFNWTVEHPEGAWFCETTHTKKEDRKREIRELFDERMKGAQALDTEDFKKADKWQKEQKLWINDNCK